ncbi:hypothetical protein [Streptomyces spirodelae]|uniref:Uncharacterized protein n=1 Tax=Streptomyces spirodelae TaxID=2812904 RepID=A0ABS3X1J4_9ACTN|nr:hypothetical protein [Streptomyces spirodelae]MBO8189198.1 hypothetical protein [Streptomyces spirodelae]
MDEEHEAGEPPPNDGRWWCVGGLAVLGAVGHLADIAQVVEFVNMGWQYLR